MTIGDVIRILMEARGWRPADIARLSGISPPQISLILSDKSGFSRQSLEAIAGAFGMSFVQMIAEGSGLNVVTPANAKDYIAVCIRELLGKLPTERETEQVIAMIKIWLGPPNNQKTK